MRYFLIVELISVVTISLENVALDDIIDIPIAAKTCLTLSHTFHQKELALAQIHKRGCIKVPLILWLLESICHLSIQLVSITPSMDQLLQSKQQHWFFILRVMDWQQLTRIQLQLIEEALMT